MLDNFQQAFLSERDRLQNGLFLFFSKKYLRKFFLFAIKMAFKLVNPEITVFNPVKENVFMFGLGS
ncbi:hypothetical protein EFJ78_04520 [Pediococcus pentosaceus]|nr:hypothetical protein [Pediococcus pentosaceus]MCS8567398.1 hypothetical protein [Pediococcus pentosaceus]MCS8569029.1 hypothetical protein [Pediococcus pentosaceus]MCS8580928.1 hypothetical protein [Pediococcus pentosaceus]MCT3022982.1 hypothetical protein [Pediococcus pentosaceus]